MSAGEGGGLRLLHIASGFSDDEECRRIAALIDHFGPRLAHTMVVAPGGGVPGSLARAIHGQRLEWPLLAGGAGPIRLQRLAEAMRGYDLVLTYGWGAMNAVLAHTAFGPRLGLGPLIHHEHRLEPDEVERRKTSRNLRRMLAFARIAALVVPSERMQAIAVAEWKVPPGKVHRIAPGLASTAPKGKPRRDALPRVVKRPGELFLGTLAAEADGADLLFLVRAFAAASLADAWQLVMIGHTAAGDAILDEAVRLEIGHRVHLTGPVADPGKALSLCDLFAWLGGAETFPLSLTEAMAAGLATVGWDQGDAVEVVAEANRRFLSPPGDEAALASALAQLAGDAPLRDRIGALNRDKARAGFTVSAMLAVYRALYARVLGRDHLP